MSASPTLTWSILVAATLGSFALAEYLPNRHVAIAAIFMFAGFKVRLILRNFMELRQAPVAWRITFDVWTVGCAAMIAGLYWFSAA